MPTHCSLTIVAIALAQVLVAANARYERGIYLSEIPENINPDDLYNEMVYSSIEWSSHRMLIWINLVNVEICRFPCRIHRKLAMVKGIPRCCNAEKLRKVSRASRNIESHRRGCQVHGRWTIADTTCAREQRESSSTEEDWSQLLYVQKF